MSRFPPAPVSQPWDRCYQQHAAPDYGMMQVDSMVSYDPRPVPSTTALQRPTMASQYTVGTSYAESPVTPMASSPYGSQGHFGEYPPCTYQSPTIPSTSSAFSQIQYRTANRPLAPPTPPLDEERGMRVDAGRLNYPMGDACQKSSRRSPTVKSEAKEEAKDIKSVPKFVKANGELQYESNRKFDLVLRLAEKKIVTKQEPMTSAVTPEPMGSPAGSPEDEQKPGPPKPEKKYLCPVEACDRRFAQKAQLETHTRSHTGEKPYACNECDFRATQPGNLKTHKKIHSPEKPFRCPMCGLDFKSKGSLKPHISIKHENRPKHKCPLRMVGVCKKDFTTIGNMKNHIDNHHKPEVQHYQTMLENYNPANGELDPKIMELLKVLLEIYKNSNRGIKGRGAGKDKEKDKKPRDREMKRESHQELTPVSPDPNHAIQDYSRYYEPPQQSQYHVLPHPGQSQPHPSYVQLPLHAPQHQPYHGISQPSAYSMGWGHSPQYH